MKPTVHISIPTGLLAVVTIAWLNPPCLAQSWNQLAPTGGPPSARETRSASVFDPATNQLIHFGGSYGANLNDVWSLTLGANPQWMLVATTGGPPAPRNRHTAVYDSANARMIIFGGGLGSSSPCANDVWVLSNANSVGGTPTWTQLSPTGGPPAPRLVHTAVYDPISNSMIIFGGNNCSSGFFSDVWVLSNANGLGGTPTWTQLSPSGTSPGPRGYDSAVYDPGSNRMIFFGAGPAGSVDNITWVLSSANGLGGTPTWTPLAVSGTPPAIRDSHAAVYDVASNRMILFGGAGYVNNVLMEFNDVWVLSDANGLGGTSAWTQLTPSGTPPPARVKAATVYDPATNRMIIFGGVSDLLGVGYNDTWVLSNANGAPVDITPPVITPAVTGTLGSNNWYVSNVDVSWTASDFESGISSSTGCGTTNLIADTPGTTVTCSATNGASLSTTVSVTPKIDKTPPTVAVTGVANGATYTLGAVPAAGCTTTDGLSGVAVNATLAVTGGTANGVGAFTATCSGGKDNAGNTAAPANVTYSVHYGFAGFFSPVSMGIYNLVNAGQSVPMKWQLTNSSGAFISTLSAVSSITSANLPCGGGATSAPLPADTSGASGLHYDTTSNQYIFSWKTDKTWGGSCRRFLLQLDDGTTHNADFTLR